MAIYKFTDVEAKNNFATSKGVRWFKAGAAKHKIGKPESLRVRFANWLLRQEEENQQTSEISDLAFDKIRHNRIFHPAINPTFKIDKDWKVYAIGSCFARGIEKSLIHQGFDVLSAAKEFDDFELAAKGTQQLGFTNKYTTHSILNELRWALVPGEACPEQSIIDLESGLSIDPHINPTLVRVNREETVKRRKLITEVQSRITECKLIVLTLGLVECWKDTQTGVFLNSSPTKEMFDEHAGRYELHVLGYEENKQNLEEIYKILEEFGHPDLHIIVTVSPVPLLATYTGRDIVVANTFSKSTLRVVAEEWASTKKNVNYFPSYEIVSNSQRDVAWEEDLRHVRGEVVMSIMGLMMKNYIQN